MHTLCMFICAILKIGLYRSVGGWSSIHQNDFHAYCKDSQCEIDYHKQTIHHVFTMAHTHRHTHIHTDKLTDGRMDIDTWIHGYIDA